MAEQDKMFGAGRFVRPQTFTQLTAPGLTDAKKNEGMRDHTISVTVDNKNTNVGIQLVGSIDGTNFFLLPLENVVVSGITITANVATITADGTYLLYVKDIPMKFIKCQFASESGGTDATVDFAYYGQS